MALFPFSGRIHAPDFKPGLTWFNSEGPIALQALRGRLVLLDFWTYCCINCMHVLPGLKVLEQKYRHQLTVIGVHSPKFPHEKADASVRQAILRHEIEHPVVNDPNLHAWQEFGVRAWPTLALIDPEGIAVCLAPGEGNFEALDQLIAELIEIFRMKGSLKESPWTPMPETAADGDLSFPGKIHYHAASRRLYVSDSNHHRILSFTEDGQQRESMGCGEAGDADGDLTSASFSHPQGICRVDDTLYVADTENHLLRAVDLKNGRVATVAGTGVQAQPFDERGTGMEASLNSPWDLAYVKPNLYLAMAGSHQIWSYQVHNHSLAPFAGSGQEARIDGPHAQAALAQPSGLATDGKFLYVADSEVSSVRKIDLNARGKVETLVGLDLFVFGDADGKGREVRLQHCLGVAWNEGKLYVADTYNHKIKTLDPRTLECRTLAGTGRAGNSTGGTTEFNEPSGLAVAGEKIYVADTNNHRIVMLDKKTGRSEVFAGAKS